MEQVVNVAYYHATNLQSMAEALEAGRDEAIAFHATGARAFYQKALDEALALGSYFTACNKSNCFSGLGDEARFSDAVERTHYLYLAHKFQCQCKQCQRQGACACSYAYCEACAKQGRTPTMLKAATAPAAPTPVPLKSREELYTLPLSEAYDYYRKVRDLKHEVRGEALEQSFWERFTGAPPRYRTVLALTPQAQDALNWRQELPQRLQNLVNVYEQALAEGISEAAVAQADLVYDTTREDEQRLEAQREERAKQFQQEQFLHNLKSASERSTLDLRDLL